jgi:DNA gyrase subunit B
VDASGAEKRIIWELASLPEAKRLRVLGNDIVTLDKPPFIIETAKENGKPAASTTEGVSQPGAVELLEHVLNEGKKAFTVTRYKGLGEMNPDQLWATTMNAESRSILQVRLEDAVESEKIFSTLMGEDVEVRRKFIEENALDVKNLDV